jgi:hypothetical protein
MFNAISTIYKTEGPLAFWKGTEARAHSSTQMQHAPFWVLCVLTQVCVIDAGSQAWGEPHR